MIADALFPSPTNLEEPTLYAARVGEWYGSQNSLEFRKSHGMFFTPQAVAEFMASTLRLDAAAVISILDPAAGCGILLCSVVQEIVRRKLVVEGIVLFAYEIEPSVIKPLNAVLSYLVNWASNFDVRVEITVIASDFVLDNASQSTLALSDKGLSSDPPKFDIVITNPPYFKIALSDPRAIAAREFIHGQPNLYGLFLAVSSALLRNGGELVSITPRSFASGPYFRILREHLFKVFKLELVHLFTSRRATFSDDDILQENIVVHAIRQPFGSRVENAKATISHSYGPKDLGMRTQVTFEMSDILDTHFRGSILKLPTSRSDFELMKLIESWTDSLETLDLQISTGPVVAFRATQHLIKSPRGGDFDAPLLWMQHVQFMEIKWPIKIRKEQYIANDRASQSILLPNKHYVVMRRFSSKDQPRRLTVAPHVASKDGPSMLGLENHLNYIYRKNGEMSLDEVFGLSAVLSSTLFDSYFRIINGNTQVSATELRIMPLPPRERIKIIGEKLQRTDISAERVDEIVHHVLAL